MGKKQQPSWHLHPDLRDCGCRRWLFSRDNRVFYLLDEPGRALLRECVRVPLEPRPFNLLMVLLRRHARLVSKAELRGLLWGDRSVEDHVLTKCVSKLRLALDPPASGTVTRGEPFRTAAPWLTASYGAGYRLELVPHRLGPPAAIAPDADRDPLLRWLARQGGIEALPVTIQMAVRDHLPQGFAPDRD